MIRNYMTVAVAGLCGALIGLLVWAALPDDYIVQTHADVIHIYGKTPPDALATSASELINTASPEAATTKGRRIAFSEWSAKPRDVDLILERRHSGLTMANERLQRIAATDQPVLSAPVDFVRPVYSAGQITVGAAALAMLLAATALALRGRRGRLKPVQATGLD